MYFLVFNISYIYYIYELSNPCITVKFALLIILNKQVQHIHIIMYDISCTENSFLNCLNSNKKISYLKLFENNFTALLPFKKFIEIIIKYNNFPLQILIASTMLINKQFYKN